MTAGNGQEHAGTPAAVGSTDNSTGGPIDRFTEPAADDADGTPEPAAPASADRPGERRRKAGVRYRPV